MRLAWRNLNYDRLRFGVTIVGIAFSVFLMVFQGSLLAGFVRASSRVIDASDAAFWISAKGVPCFECAAPVPSRYREIAMGTRGVAAVQRVATGAAVWQKPTGMKQLVYLIGTDPGVGDGFPFPYFSERGGPVEYERVLVDRSNAAMLEVDAPGLEIEINRRRARVGGIIEDFGSFIAQPYLFTTYSDATRYLGSPAEGAQFLAAHLSPGYDPVTVRRELQARLPEVSVLTREEFSRRAQVYWIVQTGAGGALLTAALLGFIVGAVVVSQTIYPTTMDSIEEFATLKAIGASRHYIRGVVLTQALISGLVGALIGVAITFPLVRLVGGSIPWVYMPWWLPVGIIGVSLLMCAAASTISIRRAVAVEPGRVFRA